MDLFGFESKRKLEAYERATEHEPRAQFNYALIMAYKNMERILAATIATAMLWLIVSC